MNIGAQTAWFVAASLAYRINRRLVASSRAEEYSEIIAETKQIGDELAQACRIAVSHARSNFESLTDHVGEER
jgi:hypothetical protein